MQFSKTHTSMATESKTEKENVASEDQSKKLVASHQILEGILRGEWTFDASHVDQIAKNSVQLVQCYDQLHQKISELLLNPKLLNKKQQISFLKFYDAVWNSWILYNQFEEDQTPRIYVVKLHLQKHVPIIILILKKQKD